MVSAVGTYAGEIVRGDVDQIGKACSGLLPPNLMPGPLDSRWKIGK